MGHTSLKCRIFLQASRSRSWCAPELRRPHLDGNDLGAITTRPGTRPPTAGEQGGAGARPTLLSYASQPGGERRFTSVGIALPLFDCAAVACAVVAIYSSFMRSNSISSSI